MKEPSHPQRPLLGVFWMLVTGALFVGVTALVKVVGDRIPAPQSAFLRYALGLVFFIPFARSMLRAGLHRQTAALLGGRGLVHSVAVMAWFFAMTQLPLAEVTALNYASPVYVTIGAALFLGETLAFRRIAAVFVAFIGALIILRPGVRAIEPGHFAMLLAGLLFGGSYLAGKVLSDRMSPIVVVGWLSVVVTLALTPFALSVWVTPTWTELGLLFLVSAFATAGHTTMTMAFQEAPLAVTQPVTFLQLLWATLLGAFVFAEPVDIYVVAGGTLILGAVSFITWREAVLKRRATPAVGETKI